ANTDRIVERYGSVEAFIRDQVFGGRQDPAPPSLLEPPPDAVAVLATELYVDPEWIQRVLSLFDDKPQLILYGPPGTGKTFMARRLAVHLAGTPGRVQLVQFHPA